MSRQAELAEANIRAKRWAKAACDAGLVKGGANPEVSYSEVRDVNTRWRVTERLKWTLDGTADGPKVDTEACVAAAPSAAELLHKYALWAQDENRHAYFHERHVRGERLTKPPPDPPEWAEHRKAMFAAVDRANDATAEWTKKAAQGWMRHAGLYDPVKFELAWQRAKELGLVKG